MAGSTTTQTCGQAEITNEVHKVTLSNSTAQSTHHIHHKQARAIYGCMHAYQKSLVVCLLSLHVFLKLFNTDFTIYVNRATPLIPFLHFTTCSKSERHKNGNVLMFYYKVCSYTRMSPVHMHIHVHKRHVIYYMMAQFNGQMFPFTYIHTNVHACMACN